MGDVKVVRGLDGKLLGLVFDGRSFIDRRDYGTYEEFLTDFATIVSTRIPRDEKSSRARKMIEADEERLKGLFVNAMG